MVNIPISVVTYMLQRAVLAKRTRILEKWDCESTGLGENLHRSPQRTVTASNQGSTLWLRLIFGTSELVFAHNSLFSLTESLSPHTALLFPLFLPMLYFRTVSLYLTHPFHFTYSRPRLVALKAPHVLYSISYQ